MKVRDFLSLLRSRKVLGLILLIFFIFITLMIPLYQMGVNHTLRKEIKELEMKILKAEEKEREVRSLVARSHSPEALINEVIEKEIDYKAIDMSSAIVIAR